MLVVLSVFLGFGFAHGFGRDIKKMKFFTRQLSYFCTDNPRPYDLINNFIGDFLNRRNIEYQYNETSSGSTFSSAEKDLRVFVMKDGQNVMLFGMNDIYGKRANILDSFKIEATKALSLSSDTELLSITSFPGKTVSPAEKSKEKEKTLMLEEPMDFFLQRMRPVVNAGRAMIILGFIWLGFGIAGKIGHLGLEGWCFTASLILGGPLIGVGWVFLRIPNQSRPIKVYEEGILESFSPPESWDDPKNKFYHFNNLKCVKDNQIPTVSLYEFKFESPSRGLRLNKNIPGIDKVIEHIRKNYPQTIFR